MYQQNYYSMQTWIILEQKDNDNSKMISANCAVGHSLKKGRVHMLFICQRGLQGFQVVKRSPYILLPFEQLKNSIQRGGLKKMFSKIWLIITAARQQSDCFSHNNGLWFWFWQQSIYKKIKKPSLFYSVLQNTTNAMNTSNYFKRLKSLIVSIIKKCKHEKFRQIIFRQMFYP